MLRKTKLFCFLCLFVLALESQGHELTPPSKPDAQRDVTLQFVPKDSTILYGEPLVGLLEFNCTSPKWDYGASEFTVFVHRQGDSEWRQLHEIDNTLGKHVKRLHGGEHKSFRGLERPRGERMIALLEHGKTRSNAPTFLRPGVYEIYFEVSLHTRYLMRHTSIQYQSSVVSAPVQIEILDNRNDPLWRELPSDSYLKYAIQCESLESPNFYQKAQASGNETKELEALTAYIERHPQSIYAVPIAQGIATFISQSSLPGQPKTQRDFVELLPPDYRRFYETARGRGHRFWRQSSPEVRAMWQKTNEHAKEKRPYLRKITVKLRTTKSNDRINATLFWKSEGYANLGLDCVNLTRELCGHEEGYRRIHWANGSFYVVALKSLPYEFKLVATTPGRESIVVHVLGEISPTELTINVDPIFP